MYHSPLVQPLLTNVESSFERLLGIFQDGGVILGNLGREKPWEQG